ncbi:MAG: hypothetical protein HUJ75_04635 [Parasporobacterium sp.]|nr:hypothetical protein [Parasporobacterium sp.]
MAELRVKRPVVLIILVGLYLGVSIYYIINLFSAWALIKDGGTALIVSAVTSLISCGMLVVEFICFITRRIGKVLLTVSVADAILAIVVAVPYMLGKDVPVDSLIINIISIPTALIMLVVVWISSSAVKHGEKPNLSVLWFIPAILVLLSAVVSYLGNLEYHVNDFITIGTSLLWVAATFFEGLWLYDPYTEESEMALENAEAEALTSEAAAPDADTEADLSTVRHCRACGFKVKEPDMRFCPVCGVKMDK